MYRQSALHTTRIGNPATATERPTWSWFDLRTLPANEIRFATPGGNCGQEAHNLETYPWVGVEDLGASEWRLDFFATEEDAEADVNAQDDGEDPPTLLTLYVHANGTIDDTP